ncbi:hypothetical protein ACX12M_17095 [Cellulosimicrobium cellulans]
METWALLLTAIGAGGIITKLVDNTVAWLKGRQAEERDAWAERDKEARARRILEDALHRTRRIAADRGATDDELGPWPKY